MDKSDCRFGVSGHGHIPYGREDENMVLFSFSEIEHASALTEEGRMLASWRMMVVTGAGLLTFAGATYAASDWLTGKPEDQLKTLAEIQPGLGTVMMEYAARYTNTYYAAKGGNWDLAAYMMKEALEIQEVGETTRPARAGALKAFETAYLEPLNAAIAAKDFQKFD